MKQVILTFLVLTTCHCLQAQSTNDFLISGGLDIFKTDNTKVFGKAQVGLDVNYFIQRRFAVGAGAELWTQGRTSFVMGVRWYPGENIFLRFRGLIGAGDASLGVGWAKPISRNLRFEGMADIYFAKPDLALRAGIGYVINYVTRK